MLAGPLDQFAQPRRVQKFNRYGRSVAGVDDIKVGHGRLADKVADLLHADQIGGKTAFVLDAEDLVHARAAHIGVD